MLKVQLSPSNRNPYFASSVRRAGEDNVAWVERNADAGTVHALLVGASSTWDQRLRTAQSHMRHDLTPSHWSHVALLAPVAARPARTAIAEIPLLPRRGLATLPYSNGVVDSTLGDYADTELYPNIAVIALPFSWSDVQAKVRYFKRNRTTMDALELQLAWLAFAWGVGRLNNPLYDQMGFASAALLEHVASGLGYDLTPAFPSGASCPEAIWQAACYWHDTPRTGPAASGAARIAGRYALGAGVPEKSASRRKRRKQSSRREASRRA